ncbi:sushi, von Willebrand factor type A, EGF and pentraxin domain-containing protein 1-like isoform X2 [Glandiceps talaboti]
MVSRPILAVVSVLFILPVFVSSQGTSNDGDSCQRNQRVIDDTGRSCTKACTSNDNCSGNKQCLCDDDCGLSCVNPNARCTTLDQIDYGNVEQGRRVFGETASYTCDNGYKLSRGSNAQRHCQGNREWSGTAPTCVIDVSCGTPRDIDNARHDGGRNVDSYDVGDRVMYNCNSGYFRRGIAVSRCLQTGQWSVPQQLECVAKSCGSPGSISNGKRIGNLYTFPNRVYFECNTGYTLLGRNYRSCQTNQEWSGFLPECIPVSCPDLFDPDDGLIFGSRFNYNQQVRYQCHNGFKVVGSQVRTCQADGAWSGQDASCQELNCGPPEPIWNGQRDSNFFGLQSVILFTCNAGYRLEGSRSTYCQEDETWSTPTPNCWGRCTVEDPPEHGRITHRYIGADDVVEHGTTLNFACDGGYDKSHQDAAQCFNGTWQNIPTCDPRPCQPISEPNQGSIDQTIQDGVVHHDSYATYSCDRGYYIDGQEQRRCWFGTWLPSSNPITCEALLCSTDRTILHGSVTFLLNNGHITGNPRRSNLVQGTRRQFSCDDGYTLEGEQYNTCDVGEWTQYKPVCNPDPCGDVPDRNDVYQRIHYLGHSNFDGTYPDGNRATVTCIEGRTLNGNGILTCRAGKWYPQEDLCIEASCIVGAPPVNGDFYPGYSEYQEVESGNSVRYQCDDGYELRGNQNVWCDNGQFGELPECVAAPCNSFPVPYRGIVSYDNYRRPRPHGTIATFDCQSSSYEVNGGEQRVCQFGVWTGADVEPDCVEASCPLDADNRPDHSSVIPDQSRLDHSSSLTYGCQDGYEMEGYENLESKEIRCWFGRWHPGPELPECKPKRCLLPIIGFRYIDIRSNYIASGESISFNCLDNKVTYPSSGQISCLNGDFIPTRPRCMEAPCEISEDIVPPLKLVTPLDDDTNQVEDGTRIHFGCFDGFVLENGDEVHVCHNGRWSTVPVLDPVSDARIPECKQGCTPLQDIQNGRVNYVRRFSSRGLQQTVAQFDCDPGYDLYGVTELVCDSLNDEWLGGAVPVCRISQTNPEDSDRSCTKLPLLENGTVRINGQIYDGRNQDFPNEVRVDFSCFSNYRLDGFSYTECQDGRWIHLFPTCVDTRLCHRPTNNPNVTIFYNHKPLDEYTQRYFPHGGLITQRCTDIFKYKLQGLTTRTCYNGQWTNEAAVCVESVLEVGMEGNSPQMITEDGEVVVYPHSRSTLYIDCISSESVTYSVNWYRTIRRRALTGYRIQDSDIYRTRFRPPNNRQSDTYTCKRKLNNHRNFDEHSIVIRMQAITCPAVTTPVNGRRTIISHPLSRDEIFILGEQVQFSCNPGYRLEGASLLTCTYRGEWSDLAPVCRENTCSNIISPENGRSDGTTLTVGGKKTFTCDEGYVLQGVKEIECTEDLLWSADVPTCQAENRCGESICNDWEICVNEECICRPASHCEDGDPQLICGSDGRTYSSMCRLNATKCSQNQDIYKAHDGRCPEPVDQCDGYICDDDKECYIHDDGNPDCQCIDECDDEGDIVCGTNGAVYSNICNLRVAKCEKPRLQIEVDETGSSCVQSTREVIIPVNDPACHASCALDSRLTACQRVTDGESFVVAVNLTSITESIDAYNLNVKVLRAWPTDGRPITVGETEYIRAPKRKQDGCQCPPIEFNGTPTNWIIFGTVDSGNLQVGGHNYVKLLDTNEGNLLEYDCPNLFAFGG